MKPQWKWPLGIVSAAVVVVGLVGYGGLYRASVAQAHNSLMQAGGAGRSPALTYAACLQQSACSSWLSSEMGGEFSALWTAVLGFGAIGLVTAIGPRRKKKVYPGGFALRQHLHDLRIVNWFSDRIAGCSLLVGYHLPLPDSGDGRERVLTGGDFSNLDRALLAVSPGYGKRPELGHLAAFGMTRSGKSVHLMTQIARWAGSFVVLDVKGELYQKTAGLKGQSHRVIALTPTGSGMRFDAVSEILKSSNGYATVAEIITTSHVDKDPAFAQRAASGIEAALRVAVIKGEAPIPFIRKLVMEGGITAFYRELTSIDDPDVATALNTFLGISGGGDFDPDKAMNDRFLMSSWGNMLQRLKPFMQREVQHLFSGSDFTPADLLKRPLGVYLIWPEESLEATTSVYNLVVLGLVRGMIRHVDNERQGKLPRVPVIFGLDEAARAPLVNLDAYLSTTASRGISMLLYLQSPAQFDGLYGKAKTEAILANCATQLFYKVENLSTAEYISRRCHKVSVDTQSQSRKRTPLSGVPTINQGSMGREVITPDEVIRMGGAERQCLIAFVSGKRPILAKRLNYYEHSSMTKLLAQHSAPPIPEPLAKKVTPPTPKPGVNPEAESPDEVFVDFGALTRKPHPNESDHAQGDVEHSAEPRDPLPPSTV